MSFLISVCLFIFSIVALANGAIFIAVVIYLLGAINWKMWERRLPMSRKPLRTSPISDFLLFLFYPIRIIFTSFDLMERLRRDERFRVSLNSADLDEDDLEIEPFCFKRWKDAVEKARELARSSGKTVTIQDCARIGKVFGMYMYLMYVVDPNGDVRKASRNL